MLLAAKPLIAGLDSFVKRYVQTAFMTGDHIVCLEFFSGLFFWQATTGPVEAHNHPDCGKREK